jgi:radical SAM superfamily enzyme YgiQ (UPF0313 family)
MNIVMFSTPVMDADPDGALKPIGYDASRECPPYGTYLLATRLRHFGHEVTVGDLIADGSASVSKYLYELSSASLVGISATTLSWPTALAVIKQIREVRPDVPVVLGGVHPSSFPTHILANSSVDYVICGEGEISLPMLAEALENGKKVHHIPGLVWRSENGQLFRGHPNSRLDACFLSSTPPPDYSLIPRNTYKGLSIESSRGCNFNCSFCAATYRGRWVPLTAESFVDNLVSLLTHIDGTSLQLVYIIDDEFSQDPVRCIRIAEEIQARGLHPKLTYNSRVNDILHEQFIEYLRPYTHQILVGAECGYEEGLKKIGKGTDLQSIERAAAILAKYGLSQVTDFSFIIGLPWETREHVHKTLEFSMRLLSTYGIRILLQWYLQIPGSRLWDQYRQNESVHEKMYDQYGFFRDLYLFRIGNKLKPSEIWDISKAVHSAKVLSRLRFPEKQMIEHSLPLSIYESFPKQESIVTYSNQSSITPQNIGGT